MTRLAAKLGFIDLGTCWDLLEGIATGMATAQLPRWATISKNFEGRMLSWIIINLMFAMYLLPASWCRVNSPIRKKGPKVVIDPNNLRPISYVSDLEGIFDLV